MIVSGDELEHVTASVLTTSHPAVIIPPGQGLILGHFICLH